MKLKDRKLKQIIQCGLIKLLCDNSESEEDYFKALLYANAELSILLSQFDDVFDEKEN